MAINGESGSSSPARRFSARASSSVLAAPSILGEIVVGPRRNLDSIPGPAAGGAPRRPNRSHAGGDDSQGDVGLGQFVVQCKGLVDRGAGFRCQARGPASCRDIGSHVDLRQTHVREGVGRVGGDGLLKEAFARVTESGAKPFSVCLPRRYRSNACWLAVWAFFRRRACAPELHLQRRNQRAGQFLLHREDVGQLRSKEPDQTW